MAPMSFIWTLRGAGWADCLVVLGATGQWVQFNAEPTTCRWIFNQDQGQVDIRLLSVPDEALPDAAGTPF